MTIIGILFFVGLCIAFYMQQKHKARKRMQQAKNKKRFERLIQQIKLTSTEQKENTNESK